MKNTKKILIIEDDTVLSEMYAIKLKKEGFEVKEKINWLEWLSQIWDYNPDLILLDLMMPTMNGFETLQALKSQTSINSKIIVFTNVVDKEKLELAMEYWADDYLIKSNTNPSDIIEKINKMLEENNDEKAIYVKPWINKFKMKNPIDENKDIEITINIEV